MSNPNPHKLPSIEDIGLQKHLNKTAADHNGFDYIAFVNMVAQGVNPSNIARAFGVSRGTANKWLKVYDLELESGVGDEPVRV